MAIEEQMLKDVLTALAEQSKFQQEALQALTDELLALKAVVQDLDARAVPALEKHLKAHSSDPMRRAVTQRIDEIIRRLKTDVIHDG